MTTTPPGASQSGPDVALAAPQVLRLAARHAATMQELDPRPDQFIFVEDVWVLNGRYGDGTPQLSRSWLSVDGTRDGLGEGPQALSGTGRGCRDGRMVVDEDPSETVACTPTPAEQPNLPTDAAGMRAYLYRPERDRVRAADGTYEDEYAPGTSADQIAWQRLAELVRSTYTPAVHAAAFEAASTIPGTTVIGAVVDASGRPAVAVSIFGVGGNIRGDLLFDPANGYAFIGQSLVLVAPTPEFGEFQVGDILRGRAVLRVAVTDEAGQLP